MGSDFNHSLSLETLENDFWEDPDTEATYLIATVHQLRRKPVVDLTTEDLRIMIGQSLSLDILVPLALLRLADEPLAEGDYYPGDLLISVLRLPPSYWTASPEKRFEMLHIVRLIAEPEPVVAEEIREFLAKFS